MAETHGFMLVFCAITSGKTDLCKGIFKAASFRCLCEAHIVVIAPVSTLLNIAYNETTTHIRNPIGKFNC